MTKIAIVTGSNKGIGFATVRALAKQFNGIVYLTGNFFFIDLFIL
jgi:NAD(P)-dependent dehydrogenase (short-subunit alcohol dehydrogenase family)